MTECSEKTCRKPQGMIADENAVNLLKNRILYRAFAALG